MDSLATLAERWRSDAERFREYGDERGACTCELHADELERAVRDFESKPLTISEAVEESGYSESHLRALLADGKLRNVGRHGAPRIRRADLPQKPTPAGPPALSLADEALERRRQA